MLPFSKYMEHTATGCQGPPFPLLHHSTHKSACVPLGLYLAWPIMHTLCITCRVGGRAEASKNKIPKSISPFSPTCSGTAPPLPAAARDTGDPHIRHGFVAIWYQSLVLKCGSASCWCG